MTQHPAPEPRPEHSGPPTGRRERNRLHTTLTIEDVATRLFLEHGVDQVTVEQICEGADISRRSFFNYFESKAQLLSGPSASVVTPALLAEITELSAEKDLPFPAQVVELVGRAHIEVQKRRHASSIDPALSREIARRRAVLLRTSPELLYDRHRSLHEAKERLKKAIIANLTEHPANRSLRDLPLEQEAHLLVNMVTSTVWSAFTLAHSSDSGIADAEAFTAATRALGTLHAGFDRLSFE
ncbi:TetR family transcriptional regulator [Corynebacterium sp. HMSC22B11]|uniref:TetR/AcrR family transcriptional regulator n=1 Tax=Corynebacterium sp. HMSC22B11 TaxID=1581056 RepID=UPI0008A32662|nr:TetR/AcrR family transcriptional regulator [Corynebacterium sp. HMSC22B11]OFO14954.1 TetR family transcriptional regulator [Corynebacterium sp. HMSC22B11]